MRADGGGIVSVILSGLTTMTGETPRQALARWEDAGAGWRLSHFTGTGDAVVELLTCYGEPVDTLSSPDPEFLAYLRRRPTSSSDEQAE